MQHKSRIAQTNDKLRLSDMKLKVNVLMPRHTVSDHMHPHATDHVSQCLPVAGVWWHTLHTLLV